MQLPLHDTWNVTDSTKMQEYIACPRSYFYKYVLGWKSEEPNIHLVFGTAWHKAQEHLLLNGYSALTVLEAVALLTEEYRKFFSPMMDDVYYPKTPGFAADMLGKYTRKYPDDYHQADVLYTETSGSISIGDNRVMYFKTDSILQGKNGYYQNKKFSREHKTAKSKPTSQQWSLKTQIGTYNHVLYCMYGPEDTFGIELNCAIFQKTKPDFVRIPLQKGKESMQVWLWTMNHYMEEIEWEFERLADASPDDPVLMAFPLRTESCSNYFGCQYHDFCLSWPNPLRSCEIPPLGFKQEFWDPRQQETINKMDLTMEKPRTISQVPENVKSEAPKWKNPTVVVHDMSIEIIHCV